MGVDLDEALVVTMLVWKYTSSFLGYRAPNRKLPKYETFTNITPVLPFFHRPVCPRASDKGTFERSGLAFRSSFALITTVSKEGVVWKWTAESVASAEGEGPAHLEKTLLCVPLHCSFLIY